ncbi:MAG: cobalamin B12-binding domain-containing protein [Geobacteraceae bacterium]|nr:cobalamin B12-binding domain-containing protein [Geobacteraceae bacterium]
MGTNIDTLISEAQQLPQIPVAAINAYHQHIPEMCAAVDYALSERPDIYTLIGNNPLEVMYENHKHHAAFMTSVFSSCNYELLARTLPWVYQVYSSKKFLFDYFPLELRAWIMAVQDALSPEAAEKICAVYTWMLQQHDKVVKLACSADAQEHLASSIVGRVLAQVSMVEIIGPPLQSRALVSAAPGEFHEIGAWMVSDILEQDGWQVRYLGANTPTADLIKMLKSFRPHILALSVTMPFNLHKTKEAIEQIKAETELKDLFIIVGGNAFSQSKDLWRSCGADAWAANIHDLHSITTRFKSA